MYNLLVDKRCKMVKTFPWCITQNQWLLSTIMGLQKEDLFRSSQNRASCDQAGKNSLMVFNEEPEKWRNYLRIGDFNLHDNLSNLRINSERMQFGLSECKKRYFLIKKPIVAASRPWAPNKKMTLPALFWRMITTVKWNIAKLCKCFL